MNARAEVMARIRAATSTGDGAGSGERAGPVQVPRDYRRSGDHDPGSGPLLDLFTERLVDYRATVHRCRADQVAATVAAALVGRGVRTLVTPPGQIQEWLAQWDGRRLVDSPAAPLAVQVLDDADGVITGCAVGIAMTGTIVLDGAAPDQGRRAITLVPDYHLVVIAAAQVVESVPEALTRLAPRSPLTMISGPSATSDIELSRVEGVHGPRTLVVVLVEGV